MSACNKILLLTNEAGVTNAVRAALRDERQFTTNGACCNWQDLLVQLRANQAPAALIDIDSQPERILADLEHVVRSHPNTRFIVIASNLRNDWIISSMQAGARHFLLKESLGADLVSVLHRLTADQQTSDSEGIVITILTASGGSGGTTITVNLAYELHKLISSQVLLIDLDIYNGALATYFGAAAGYGIADVLSHEQRVDPELISTTAIDCAEGLRLLVSPASTNFSAPMPLRFDRLDHALKECRKVCKATIIDAPRTSVDLANQLAAQSDMTILPFQLNVKDIRNTRLMLNALSERGVSQSKLRPLVNRWRRRSAISAEDACRALQIKSIARVENDFPGAIRAMNFGQPLRKAARRSPICRDLKKLAEQIVELQCV